MEQKEFNGYLIAKDGTVTLKGKTVASGKMYINKEWHNGIDVANLLFVASPIDKSSTPKETVVSAPAKLLQHGNTGRKHTAESIVKMRLTKRKGKQIEFNGTTYNSIKECADTLGVSRQTIYRRMLSSD